jgi:protease-4
VIAIIISAVLLTVLAGGAAVIVIAAVAMNSPLPALPAKQYPYFNEQHISGSGPSSNKIAVIDVRGVILNDGGASSFYSMADSKNITDQIKFASKDKNVKGIIINIDSPGGEVVASDLIYQEIRAARAKGVPVVACMNSIAASGGYYVAAGCDYIVAHKMTLTGSIGVIIETYKYYELFTKIGVRSEVYKSGPMKDILDGSRPSTEAEKKIVQDLVNATYNDFVGIVAQGRKIPAQIIKTTEIGDGRVFDGEQALKLKLVDELGYFDTAVKKAAGMSGLNENNVQVIRYQKPFSLAQLFGEASASFSGKPLSLLPPGADRHMSLEPGKMYFLPQVW